jgi:hypothetical protein
VIEQWLTGGRLREWSVSPPRRVGAG